MAINVKFDLTNNPEPSTIILARRNGDRLGKLDVNPESISLNDKFNNASEISFTLNKYKDGKLTNLWNEVVDFKLIECKEWDTWFEIRVELDEETETIKTVFCTQLGQAELSQIKLYDIHINDEEDIAREGYKKTILFNGEDTEASLLHRIFKDKAPHYSITHVDATIAGIQRVFSFDDKDIYGSCQEIGEEIGCLFIFPSNSDDNGKIQRTVEVYDLQQNCKNPECGYRGEFTGKCPKCESEDIEYGYGEETPIFVTSGELAEGGIQLTTDTDSVKNCFKLEAGDDLMTATIRNCNPNGTDYIWYFSDIVKSDMSEELQNKIKEYDEIYKEYYNNYESELDSDMVEKYNALVDKYKDFYNAKRSTCLSCGYKGDFDGLCPEIDCHSENVLTGAKLESISKSFKGFPALMNGYYDTIDFALYLESGLMPSVEIAKTNAEEQAALLASSLSSVSVTSLENITPHSADNAVLGMAKVIVRSTFDVEIKKSTLDKDNNLWLGTLTVINGSDETDIKDTIEIEITINDDLKSFIKQKIDKTLNKEDNEDVSISGLFKKEYIDDCDKNCANCDKKDNCFQYELTKYALHPLEGFYKSCEGCLSILTEQGVGNEDSDLYEELYLPYYNKLKAIETEMTLRESELGLVEGVYEEDENGNKLSLISDGLQTEIIKHRDIIQTALNFEDYLDELWLEFCAYRREDKYSNDNYISDGLNNADLFKKAMELVDVAENEIYKSGELQHSISTDLKNLLAIPKFKSLVKHFSVGNWIRVQIDDKVYRLRLLEYDIDFGNFDSIPVTFSDATKIKNGVTDVQNILSQASSMATSYSSVQRQANQGEESKAIINNWFTNGLDATNTKIIGNAENQNQVWDENGILCRQYDPILDSYNDEQLKIINSTIAITDNSWESTKTAIGKFYYNDPADNYTLKTAFGVNGELIVGRMLLGESLGLYNESGSMGFDKNGLVIKNKVNTFAINPNSASLLTATKNGSPTLSFTENGDLKIVGEITASKLTVDPNAVIKGMDNYITENNGIAGFTIGDNYLANNTTELAGTENSVYLGINGISCGTQFKVTNQGIITASSGTIGGFTMDSTKLYNGIDSFSSVVEEGTEGIYIGTNGIRVGDDFKIYPSGALVAGARIYIRNNYSLRGMKSGADTPTSDDSNALIWTNSNNRVVVGNIENSAPTEIRSPASVYIKCAGTSTDESRYVLQWAKVNCGTEAEPLMRGVLRPTYDAENGVTTAYSNLGSQNYRWRTLYITNDAIVTSDRNLKKNINSVSKKYLDLFDLLNPVTYQLTDGDRVHTGFISQEVEDAMKQVGLTAEEFGGFCKDVKVKYDSETEQDIPILNEDGEQEYSYSLRYGEFIALNTAKIKQLEQTIKELQNEIKELKS